MHASVVTLLGGVIAIIFPTSGLRVITLDRLGLDDDKMMRRHPLGGVIMELL
jgi:hypothetical protein